MEQKIILPPLPENPGYFWRSAQRQDADAIHQLLLGCEAIDQLGFIDTMEDRERDFDDPISNFSTDSVLAFTPQGELAALGWVFTPPRGESEYISWLWSEVHPEHRQSELGSAVLSWLERRGRQILAELPDDLPHYLVTSCFDNLTHRINVYEQHDFNPVRNFYRMRRDLNQDIPQADLPNGIRLCNWSPELDESTLEAVNEAFKDHWGSIPFTPDTWKLWITSHPNFRPDLTYLALARDDTRKEQVVGFAINEVREQDNHAQGFKQAWIRELGTRRPWRNRGIGTALICISMQAFKAAGQDYAALGVDTENLTGALRIYERLGFVPFKRSITFSKKA